MSAERWLYVGLFGLIGCGPLAGGDYYGEPLFEIEGSVQADFQLDYDGDIGVALLWSNETDLAAQAVLVETRFPARYKLKIFRPPARDSALQVIGEAQGQCHQRVGRCRRPGGAEGGRAGHQEVVDAVHPQVGVHHPLGRVRGHAGRAHVVEAQPQLEPGRVGGVGVHRQAPDIGPDAVRALEADRAGRDLQAAQADPAELVTDQRHALEDRGPVPFGELPVQLDPGHPQRVAVTAQAHPGLGVQLLFRIGQEVERRARALRAGR